MYMKTRNFSGFKHLKITTIDYLSSYRSTTYRVIGEASLRQMFAECFPKSNPTYKPSDVAN